MIDISFASARIEQNICASYELTVIVENDLFILLQ